MIRKNRSSKGASKSRKKPAVKAKKTQIPPDTYEEWLKRQTVKPTVTKAEVQVPLDSYEKWIREQVKKRTTAVVG